MQVRIIGSAEHPSVLLTTAPGAVDAHEGLVEPLAAVLSAAQGLTDQVRTATFVVVCGASAAHDDAYSAACVEGVRGITQSLALEWADRTRVNVVIASTQQSAEATCEWLATQRAGFVTGSTFDVRAEQWRSL